MARAPLTDFLIALMKTPPAALAKADPDKLAQKYGIRVQDARGYIDLRKG